MACFAVCAVPCFLVHLPFSLMWWFVVSQCAVSFGAAQCRVALCFLCSAVVLGPARPLSHAVAPGVVGGPSSCGVVPSSVVWPVLRGLWCSTVLCWCAGTWLCCAVLPSVVGLVAWSRALLFAPLSLLVPCGALLRRADPYSVLLYCCASGVVLRCAGQACLLLAVQRGGVLPLVVLFVTSRVVERCCVLCCLRRRCVVPYCAVLFGVMPCLVALCCLGPVVLLRVVLCSADSVGAVGRSVGVYHAVWCLFMLSLGVAIRCTLFCLVLTCVVLRCAACCAALGPLRCAVALCFPIIFVLLLRIRFAAMRCCVSCLTLFCAVLCVFVLCCCSCGVLCCGAGVCCYRVVFPWCCALCLSVLFLPSPLCSAVLRMLCRGFFCLVAVCSSLLVWCVVCGVLCGVVRILFCWTLPLGCLPILPVLSCAVLWCCAPTVFPAWFVFASQKMKIENL